MKKQIIFTIILCILCMMFAGCGEKTDIEKMFGYWGVDGTEDQRVSIHFHEPNKEGYVRNTYSALDVSLNAMEQKYGDFKSSSAENVCGDMTFTIWDIYLTEDNSSRLENERTLYGIYEWNCADNTITWNSLVDEEQVIAESKTYRYKFKDKSHLMLINQEDSNEKIELSWDAG